MFPDSIQNLINQLSKLPDIGPRAATRLVFHLINQNQNELENLSQSLKELKSKIKLCPDCFSLTNDNLCSICSDKKRDKNTICLIETVLNIPLIEKTRQYTGLYHILGGLISPGNGTGPEDLKIKELINRVKNNSIKEIIFALSPTTEGDTTTLYIEKILQELKTQPSPKAPAGKVKTSRLGRGLSVGSDLEYIDENTLSNAFRSRR